MAHFHTWLVPRERNAPERDIALVARHSSCDEADAAALVVKLRAAWLQMDDEES